MTNASTWLQNAILNNFFRNTNVAPPAQLFLRLFISDPTPDATDTEVQGGGYTPQRITFNAPTVVDGNIQISNSAEIRFPVAGANWGNISHFAIFTAATGGNMLASAPVSIPKLIEMGDEANFLAGNITVRMVGNNAIATGYLA